MREPTLTIERRTRNGRKREWWIIRYYTLDGKKRSKSLGAKSELTKKGARKKLRTFQESFDNSPRIRQSTRPTVKQVWSDFERDRSRALKPATIAKYKGAMNHLYKYFSESTRVESLTDSMILDFINHLSDGKATEQTVRSNMRSLRAIFGHAYKTRKNISRNPFEGMAGVSEPKAEWYYMPIDELNAILKVAGRFKVLFALCRLAGLRRQEALHLTWDDVDFETPLIQIRPKAGWSPKSRTSIRKVPIFPPLMKVLTQALGEAQEGQPLVCGHIYDGNITRDLEVVLGKADVDPYADPLHSLRKACLTDFAKDFPFHCVHGWAGHKNYQTTLEYYLRVGKEFYEQAAKSNLWADIAQLTDDRTDGSDIDPGVIGKTDQNYLPQRGL